MPNAVPYYSQKPRIKFVKRYIKFLSVCKDPQTLRVAVKRSPDSVVKGICNCALNAQKGDIRLNPHQKKILAKHRREIQTLSESGTSIKKKRSVLNQKGGFTFLPLLLSTVLGTLGSSLFNQNG